MNTSRNMEEFRGASLAAWGMVVLLAHATVASTLMHHHTIPFGSMVPALSVAVGLGQVYAAWRQWDIGRRVLANLAVGMWGWLAAIAAASFDPVFAQQVVAYISLAATNVPTALGHVTVTRGARR